MLDILLCSVPSIEMYLPPAAPATLKGHIKDHGFTSKCIDLNLLMFQHKEEKFNQLNAYFTSEDSVVPAELAQDLDQVLDLWVETILENDFKWLGLSVFSTDSRRAVLDLCEKLSTIDKKFKIVIGGLGLTHQFAERMKSQGLIDAYILGEGEHALVNLLSGNMSYPGVNSHGKQIDNLDELGFVDYSDYQLDQYKGFYDEPIVLITGSRGCVRSCTFCDTVEHWPKFRYRSGEHITKEIINIYEEKGIHNFYFTDSLINGSMSAYMRMCETLADYNTTHKANITWGGQYIVRPPKGLPSDYYSLTAASGAFNLALGIETGSDSVRNHMKKQFSNSDLDIAMENFAKHRITCSYLIIVGYPTETQEDFYETLRMFKRHQKYAAQGIILGVSLGATLIPVEGSPIAKMLKNEITFANKSLKATWIVQSNPQLDYQERVKRRLQAELVLDHYGYNLISSDRNFNNLIGDINVLKSNDQRVCRHSRDS